MAWRDYKDGYQTEYWVLGVDRQSDTSSHRYVDEASDIDSLLADLSADAMASPSLKSSLTQYEELVRKQLNLSDESSPKKAHNSGGSEEEEGLFDQPLTQQRQQGMRAVQNTLEKLDSKHGVLQRHASAECVRDVDDDTDLLKRTMSDSIKQANGDARSEQTTKTKNSSTQEQQETQSKPQVKQPLTTNRSIPVKASKSSAATGGARAKSGDGEGNRPVRPSQQRAEESPEKALSLRQLLADSKTETSELRKQIEELIEENTRLKEGKQHGGQTNGYSSSDSASHAHKKLAESERRCDQLIREKENMTTELWKLRQQVEGLMNAKSELGSEMGEAAAAIGSTGGEDSQQHSSTSTYKSDNSNALKRKISDLEGQLQDLQEANETSSAEVLRLDQENQMLTSHIKDLKSKMSEDIEAEREQLHRQLMELQKRHQNDDEIYHLKNEIAQLRIDLKAMQEKTNILQEENVKLRETVRENKYHSNRWSSSSSNLNEEKPAASDKELYSSNREAAWDEINSLKQKIKEFSIKSPMFTSTTSRVNGERSSYLSNDRSRYSSAFSHTRPDRDTYTSSANAVTSSSTKLPYNREERPPSPSANSDISESTTVLMAGCDAYKPLSRSANMTRLTSSSWSNPNSARRIEDDRISECTMDIINEAAYNTKNFGALLNEELSAPVESTSRASSRADSNASVPAAAVAVASRHTRRGSLGESSVHSESTQERLAPPATYGLRSVLVPILPTQHNKTSVVSNNYSMSTTGRRPFAPRTPADIAVGDIAKFTRPDGRICRGVVKFVGHLHDKNETYLGLELEFQDGKHDGTYEGVRYFDCKPNRGAFVTFNKVIMVWGS